jgi:SAM-dependent methyltransferase
LKKSTERFSDRVENYVKYRPGYPSNFIDYLYVNTGFSKDSIIADIGSGTGILTRLLLDRGGRVLGVELSSLQEILNLCFQSGFVIDGFYEESYGIKEIPDAIIVRARKVC